ncbi:hypothetical protein A9R05_05325 [Burkholderia sp. KK1]|nr:hypothetical protein A9R05_05325 [Burkholderia sp. KK1]
MTIWKTTYKAVCVPLTEDRDVAEQWRSNGYEVIEFSPEGSLQRAFDRGWDAATSFYASDPEIEKDIDKYARAKHDWKERAIRWMLVRPLLDEAFRVLWKPDDPEDDGPEYCAKRDELGKVFIKLLIDDLRIFERDSK